MKSHIDLKLTVGLLLLAAIGCLSPGAAYKSTYRTTETLGQRRFFFLSEATVGEINPITFKDDGQIEGNIGSLGFPACPVPLQWNMNHGMEDKLWSVEVGPAKPILIFCPATKEGFVAFQRWKIEGLGGPRYTGVYSKYINRPEGRGRVLFMEFGGQQSRPPRSAAYVENADELQIILAEKKGEEKKKIERESEEETKRNYLLGGLPKGGRYGDGYRDAKWGITKQEFARLGIKETEPRFYLDAFYSVDIPMKGSFESVIQALTSKYGAPIGPAAHSTKTDFSKGGDYFECKVSEQVWDDGITRIIAAQHIGNMARIGNSCDILAGFAGIRVTFMSKHILQQIELAKNGDPKDRL